MAQFLKRAEVGRGQAKQATEKTISANDEQFAKKYPALAEFLSLDDWGEDQVRERGTFTVFYAEGLFKASLNDKDGERSAYVSKSTFAGILDALEKGLVKDDHDWRKWKDQKGGKSRKS